MPTPPTDPGRIPQRRDTHAADRRHGHDERARSARVSAMLKFAGHLAAMPAEIDILAGLLQAIAVWYDLDARAYRRDARGYFVLRASLPGANVADGPIEIADCPCAPKRISSLAELHHLGWPNPVGDVVLVPIALVHEPEWLLAVVGASGPDLESELGSLASVVGTLLDRLALKREFEFRSRLTAIIGRPWGSGRDTSAGLLDEIARTVSAARAALWLAPRGGRAQPLATYGAASGPAPELRAGVEISEGARLVLPVPAWTHAAAALELVAGPSDLFSPERLRLARTAVDILGVWLAGVGRSGAVEEGVEQTVSTSFEARLREEIERAKRFGLPVSVLVVNVSVPGTPSAPVQSVDLLTQELRAQLRACDVIGTLDHGDIAVLFAQTDSQGLSAALGRILQRLDVISRRAHFPTIRIGRAVFPSQGQSAADLLSQARLGAQMPAGLIM